MELIKPDINIDFVGKRKLAFILSGLLLLMTVASLVMHGGLNQGIDFAGGILVQVRFNEPTDAAAIKKSLTPLGMHDSTVQSFGREGNEFLIRAEKAGLQLQGLGDRVRETLQKAYPKGIEVRRVEMVGPKVGHDLRRKALLAIFYAILLIVVYISGRFEAKWGLSAIMAGVLVGAILLVQSIFSATGGEDTGMVPLIITALVVTMGACWLFKLRYALGAIVALIHDVAITVGVFSIMGKEFTLPIVAALLTIIGYSLNDTIVVFDRIRENLRKSGRVPLAGVINDSVNQTLSRTILTSGTTLAVVAALWILGGGVIEDFAFALLIGIIVGTYSSIFVASPILLLLPEGKAVSIGARKKKSAAPAPAPEKPESKKQPSVQKQAASRKRKKGGKRRK
jgi:preprotein translocase subunit SecF